MRQHVPKNSPLWAQVRAEFVAAQAGKCAICQVPLTSDVNLDHCHATGFLRGALCTGCNAKLGWYEKQRRNIELYLAKAGEYTAYSHEPKRRPHAWSPQEQLYRYWTAIGLRHLNENTDDDTPPMGSTKD